MRGLPNVWPQGGLFAFSGIDGPTCHAEPFVLAGAADAFGWDFWLKPRLSLRFEVEGEVLRAERHPEAVYLPDCWRGPVAVGGSKGLVQGGFVDRSALVAALQLGKDAPAPSAVLYDADGNVAGRAQCGDAAPYGGSEWWLAVVGLERKGLHIFGAACSYASAAEAVAMAERAANSDVLSVYEARLRFVAGLDVRAHIGEERRRTYYKAAGVQKVNTESAQSDIPCRWTTPDRMPHRHMWLWDSAFHALGLMHLDTELAEDAIRALFAKQAPDGKLSIAAQPGEGRYAVGDSQPPVVSWAAWKVFQHVGNREMVEEFYPSLCRYVLWFDENRRHDNGLFGWSVHAGSGPIAGARGGESGMDNSPRFDEAETLSAIDLNTYMASEFRVLSAMAKELGAGNDEEEWANRHADLAARVNRLLWDEGTRFYYDLDHERGLVSIRTAAGLLPLMAGIPSRDQAESLRQQLVDEALFWPPIPAPTVARNESSYSKDMWRGPAWMNLNLMLYEGLRAYNFWEEGLEIARQSVKEIGRWYDRLGCIYEFYDAEGDVPPPEMPRKGAAGRSNIMGFGNIADYHWSAAAYIYFANEAGRH